MRSTSQKQRIAAVVGAILLALVALLVFRPGERASAGVDLADPLAWIEHGLEGEVLQVNGATGEIVSRIPVADGGHDIRVSPHANGAAVLNRTTGELSVLDATLLSVVQTLELDLEDEASQREVHVFGGTTDADSIVVVDDAQLIVVDTQTDIRTSIPLGSPLRTPVQDEQGRVVAIGDQPTAIKRLGPQGLGDLSPLPDPVGDAVEDRTIVRVGDDLWLLDPARLAAVEVLEDGALGSPICMKSSANGAVVGGSGRGDSPTLVGYNPDRATLNVVELGDDSCAESELDLGDGEFGSPVVRGGFAYVPNWTTGRIEVVEIDSATRVRSFPFGSGGIPFELRAHGEIVWANEPVGAFAAIVDESGLTPIVKAATVVAGVTESAEVGDGDGDAVTAGDVDGPGVRAIGDSGEQVFSSGATSGDADAAGTGGEPGDDVGLDSFGGDDAVQPSAIGIEVQGPGETTPGADPPPETTTLIANFGVSTATAKVDEVVRFTDFSSGSPTSWTWDFGDGTGAQEPDVEKSWSTEGVYEVELIVRNAFGGESRLATEITVVARTVLIPPTADFVFDRNTLEVGETLSLESRTVGDADLLEWTLGDGTTERGPAVEHVYSEAGVYTVTLEASNPSGSTEASTEITVIEGVEAPQAAIGSIPTDVVAGQFITLRSVSLNEPTRLRWDLGDGTRVSGESVRHAWSTPGSYRVRLTVENSGGSDATFVDVTVSKRVDPPVSQFTQSATEVLVGEVVSFRSLSLNEPTRLIWNFGDETTARGETTSKAWDEPGRYRVTLRASNDAGTNRTGVTIRVVRPVDPPVASFDASTLVVPPGEAVSFEDTSTNNPTSWSWNFGDTGVSTNPNTTHVYSREGEYTVRLTVANEGGTSSAERTIEVKPAPSANFRWVTNDLSVKFTDTSWDDPQSWSWDFGDGTTSSDRSPNHVFPGEGSYDVTLVVSNGAGTSEPRTQTVTVGTPPEAAFSCEADGAVLTCDASASKRAASFRWSAPGSIQNTSPNGKVTSFVFETAGRKDITLEVASEAGVTDSLTKRSPRVARPRAPRVSDVRVVSTEGDLVRLEAEFDRNPTTWEWSVEGAQLVEGGATSRPLFRVPANGRYSGVVRVSNALGDDTDDFTFRVDSLVTQAAFDWDIVEPGVVQLVNRSIASDDAEFEWRVRGDVAVISDDPAGPVLRYPDDGASIVVVLLVRDENGDDQVTRRIDLPPA